MRSGVDDGWRGLPGEEVDRNPGGCRWAGMEVVCEMKGGREVLKERCNPETFIMAIPDFWHLLNVLQRSDPGTPGHAHASASDHTWSMSVRSSNRGKMPRSSQYLTSGAYIASSRDLSS